MFLRTREAIVAGFAKAGWSTADASGVASSVKTFMAIAAGQGYKEGPVSLLLLEGKPPDLVYQKQLNTFLDDERAKIVNDLAFASAVKDVLYVDRPAAPRADENATGDKITTDGRMAVLAMQ